MTKKVLLAVSLLIYSCIDCGSESRYGSSVYSSGPSGKNPASPSLSAITSSGVSYSSSEDEDAQEALLKKDEALKTLPENSEPTDLEANKSASPAQTPLAVAADDTVLAEAGLREHENNGGKVLQEVAKQKNGGGVVVDTEPLAGAVVRFRWVTFGPRRKSDADQYAEKSVDSESLVPKLVPSPSSEQLRVQRYAMLAAQERTQSPTASWCFCL